MTTLYAATRVSNHPSHLAFSSLVHTCAALVNRIRREARIRRDIRYVRGLTDRELLDIGITRDEIEQRVRNGA